MLQASALQHTPLWQVLSASAQVTLQLSPPQVIGPAQLPAVQSTTVSCVAPLSIKFVQVSWPLHSTLQDWVLPPQLTFPGQLSVPLQRKSQESASQRTSLVHALAFSQRTSHELPPQVTLPAQLLSAPQLTMHVVESLQSTPLEHEPGARQST